MWKCQDAVWCYLAFTECQRSSFPLPTGLVSPTSSYGDNVCWVHSPVLTIVGEAREVRHGQKHERPDTEAPSTGHSEFSS